MGAGRQNAGPSTRGESGTKPSMCVRRCHARSTQRRDRGRPIDERLLVHPKRSPEEVLPLCIDLRGYRTPALSGRLTFVYTLSKNVRISTKTIAYTANKASLYEEFNNSYARVQRPPHHRMLFSPVNWKNASVRSFQCLPARAKKGRNLAPCPNACDQI